MAQCPRVEIHLLFPLPYPQPIPIERKISRDIFIPIDYSYIMAMNERFFSHIKSIKNAECFIFFNSIIWAHFEQHQPSPLMHIYMHVNHFND